MKLSEYKKQNVFKNIKDSEQYVVYYANTEICTSEVYIQILKHNLFNGYVSIDNKGQKQNIIIAETKKEALINHLFMNNDFYADIQGIKLN